MFVRLICATLLFLAVSTLHTPGFAQNAANENSNEEETIRWTVTAEDWVTTTDADVDVRIDASEKTLNGAESAVNKVIAALDRKTGATWRAMARSANLRDKDQFGMANLSVTVRGRVGMDALSQINQEVEKQNRPGLGVRVEGINTMPSLAEREEGARRLRRNVIAMARDEADSLGLKVATIDFAPQMRPPEPRPQPVMMRAEAPMSPNEVGAHERSSNAVRITVTAVVEAR